MNGFTEEEVDNTMLVKVLKLHILATFEKAYPTDIGYDLSVCGSNFTKEGLLLIQLGVAVKPPPGYWFMLVPRSSFPKKFGLYMVNGVGIIDPGYRGEWIMQCLPTNTEGYDPRKLGYKFIGEKVAQAILLPQISSTHEFVEDLDETERGEDGFGSTDSIKQFEENFPNVELEKKTDLK